MDAKGVKLICRPSYAYTAEVMGSPFDYPLSSRLDENDSVMIFDQVLVPVGERLRLRRRRARSTSSSRTSGFIPRFTFHGCTRFAVKLDFIAGLLLKARRGHRLQGLPGRAVARRRGHRLPQPLLGADRRDGAQPRCRGSATRVLPNRRLRPGLPGRSRTIGYPRVKEIIEKRPWQRADLPQLARRRLQDARAPAAARPATSAARTATTRSSA